MNITIKTIPHKNHRYLTTGDYWLEPAGEKENMEIRVSDVDNWKHEILVAIHELLEFSLCLNRGIQEPKIMEFDKWFEERGEKGAPGDHVEAPYRKEHRFAENIERLVAHELGIDFNEYEADLAKLYKDNGDAQQSVL